MLIENQAVEVRAAKDNRVELELSRLEVRLTRPQALQLADSIAEIAGSMSGRLTAYRLNLYPDDV